MDSMSENKQWTTERVAAVYLDEVQARFEAENEKWLVEERRAHAECLAKYGEAEYKRLLGDIGIRNSFYWDVYNECAIVIDRNTVKIVCPVGFALYGDFVEMFSGTSVAWSLPMIGVELVDGEPRVTIKIVLIDYWDDERAAEWQRERETPSKQAQHLRTIVSQIRERIYKHAKDRFMMPLVVERVDLDTILPGEPVALNHVLYMCDAIEGFIDEDRLDKAHRWIGFAQGVMWTFSVATINESRQMNMKPTTAEFIERARAAGHDSLGVANDCDLNITRLCAVCREPQFATPAGPTCVNGHGGADSITE